jgi:hypothetical protein
MATLTLEQAMAKIEALEKATLAKVSLKIGTKGAISVYGLGRFPVTLYPSQWQSLLGNMGIVKDFVDANTEKCDKQQAKYAAMVTIGQSKGLKDKDLEDFIKASLN